MAAVRANTLSGATMLHLGQDSLPPGTKAEELRGMIAEQWGLPLFRVLLLNGMEELQGWSTLEGVPLDLELTAVGEKEGDRDLREEVRSCEEPRYEEESIPRLARLLCKGDGAACRRLGEMAHLAGFLPVDALRAAVALLKAGDSETSDAALRVLASAAAQQGEAHYVFPRHDFSDDFEAPQAWPFTAEALAVRDALLAAGALRALPAVWRRLCDEGKCWEERDLQHLLFRLLRGSPAPAAEEVAPVVPMLMELFRKAPRLPPLFGCWRNQMALLCAQQLCCHPGHTTALLDAGLLRQLRPLLVSCSLYRWRWGVLALLHRICAHGSEEQRDRVVGDGWLPVLLDPRPLDRLGRVADDGDEVCEAYGLHIAAMLAAAVGRAAPGQGHFMALCELLMRLAAQGRREDLRQALPWLLPPLARYRPNYLRPSRLREAARAVRAVLMAGEEHWAVVELAGFDERVLGEARSR